MNVAVTLLLLTPREITTDVFLWIAVVTAALAACALPLSTEFFDRLHYMAPVADVSAVCLLVAVVLQEGWGQAAVKMIFICIVLILMNAVLAHVTARAARVRNLGHWTPQPDEQIRGARQGQQAARAQGERMMPRGHR
jgi:multisubunit Na+/H+ antiporter MnhG subunit